MLDVSFERQARSTAVRCAALVAVAACALLLAAPAGAERAETSVLTGTVQSGGTGLEGYAVTVYAAFTAGHPRWLPLGSGRTRADGSFEVAYAVPRSSDGDEPLVVVEARRRKAMLASAVASDPAGVPARVVVNERTTVATGNAFAQFVDGSRLAGNRYGMRNAVHMAANLADPETGAVGSVLAATPNGNENSTLATFNSLANAVASCVADAPRCDDLFAAATPPGGRSPRAVLQAVANIVKYPSYPADRHVLGDPVFRLSRLEPIYQPALDEAPTSWLLFLKFTGGQYSTPAKSNLMNGPGNFAIDERGFVWVNDNADPQADGEFACAGRRLLRFTPWGEPFPGTPYFGGGLSGAGFGIALDPSGRVWVANYGFEDPPCTKIPGVAAKHDSVSVFRPDGTPLSGIGGITAGALSWPQGTASDPHGNVWVANCGSDSVTLFPGGDPDRAVNVPLDALPESGRPRLKPFGVAVDGDGNAWVTNNRGDSISVLSPDGVLLDTVPGSFDGRTVLSHPVGNATDIEGNIWVSSSDWVSVPCGADSPPGAAASPGITLFDRRTRTPHPGSPFTGGGLTLPWGMAVDGDDTVWVFNFGAVPVGRTPDDAPTAISRFCGENTRGCPRGMHVGDPISPATGYTSDALERITGGQIDPSGNVWLTNNWKLDPNPVQNPFGNAIVVAIGAAGPVKTPLLGPPVPF